MPERNFNELLHAQWGADRFVCVGLDSEYPKIPKCAVRGSIAETVYQFNCAIVEATKDTASVYKPNIAFFVAHGSAGLETLRRTVVHINTSAPDVPVVIDAKDADIGNTNIAYVQEVFDYLKADAVTVHPYLGGEALAPFLNLKNKGIIVLCRTSNSGAGEFQDLLVDVPGGGPRVPLYQLVANHVATQWNKNGNCGVVTGATYPEELGRIRMIIGDMPMLIPAIGAQGGDLEKSVKEGVNSKNQGIIINLSRSIIFASSGDDFAEAARRETLKTHDLINQYRNEKGRSVSA